MKRVALSIGNRLLYEAIVRVLRSADPSARRRKRRPTALGVRSANYKLRMLPDALPPLQRPRSLGGAAWRDFREKLTEVPSDPSRVSKGQLLICLRYH